MRSDRGGHDATTMPAAGRRPIHRWIPRVGEVGWPEVEAKIVQCVLSSRNGMLDFADTRDIFTAGAVSSLQGRDDEVPEPLSGRIFRSVDFFGGQVCLF